MKRIVMLACSVLVSSLVGCAAPTDADAVDEGTDTETETLLHDKAILPTLNAVHEQVSAPSNAAVIAAPIKYHGGPIMNNSAGSTIYFIWYGNWTGNTATTILPDFAGHLEGTHYWKINTTYTDSANKAIPNLLKYGGATSVAYPYGAALSDAQVQKVVSTAITTNKLPKDPNGIYFVLTSADVTATSGFCTDYCGWHTYASIGGTNIKYSFVGNAAHCPNVCEPQSTSPNGNAGADAMASIIAHEAEETVTDPLMNGYYDANGEENGDKCAWQWGALYAAPNGSAYNMFVGNKKYLVQQNWLNVGAGQCVTAY
jgi:hypothetical protein